MSNGMLVDVPCAVVHRGANTVTIVAAGRRLAVPRHHVIDVGPDGITVPTWYAAQERLLTTERCLGVTELAARFGHNADWIYRNITRLMEREGFPRPVTTIGTRKWDPSSVDAWFTRHHPDKPASAAPASPISDAEAEADSVRASLAEVYGSGA